MSAARPSGCQAHPRPARQANLLAKESRPVSFRRLVPAAAGILAGGLALGLYLVTLAPTVTFADSGELAAAVYHLDVAHPPGFPLYLLLARGFALLLPGVRFVQRTNAFSALCAAAAVGLLAAALAASPGPSRSARSRPRREPPLPTTDSPWGRPVLSLAAGLLLATSRTFWEQATLTEVYALNMALATGLLLFLSAYLRARDGGQPRRADGLAAGAALLSGLGLGNHLTLLFIVVAVALAVWIEEEGKFWHWRRLLLRAGLFLLGLSIYLYLPLRAQVALPLNWGDPQTLARFWRHVSAAQYRSVSFTPGPATWAGQVPFFAGRLWTEFAPGFLLLALPLAVAGLYRLFRRRRSLAWGSVAGAALTLFYALSYDIAEDQETYYMLFFLMFAFWIGHGMAQGLEWAAGRALSMRAGGKRALPTPVRRIGLRPVFSAFFPMLAVWPLLAHWPLCDRSAYTYAEAYARDVLENLPPQALVLTRDWNMFSPAYYLQEVEGVRPDVVLVDQELLRRTWYLETLERRYPWLTGGGQEALAAYRAELEKFEEGRPYEAAVIQARYQDLADALLETALRTGRPALLTPEVEYLYGQSAGQRYVERLQGLPAPAPGGVGEVYLWVPQALAFRLAQEPLSSLPEETFRQPALRDGRFHDELTVQRIRRYALYWFYRGLYYTAAGDCARAVPAFRRALEIDAGLGEAREGIAACQRAVPP